MSELSPAEYNPRKALTPEDDEYQRIKRSIETFGYIDPIIINSDGTIIGGHQRFRVLSDLGWTEVECVVLDLNKADEKTLNIALNKISGEWDEIKLQNLLSDLNLEECDLTLTGFSDSEIDGLIIPSDFEGTTAEDGFDVDGAVQKPPFVNRGEIWRLGRHRLMCGDSTDANDVRLLMGEEEMDLMITDPPYNVSYEEKENFLDAYRTNNNKQHTIHFDNMDNDSFYSFLCRAFINMEAHLRDGAAVYVFHADTNGLIFRKAFVEAGLKLSQVLIWEKSHFVLGRQDYQWRHEPILYGWKEGAAHYFIDDRTQDTVILEDDVDFEAMKKTELIQYIRDLQKDYADRTTVFYEKKPVSAFLHPTMKPIALIGKLMVNSSKKGWNVGDLFGGSGSTLMAAEQLGRSAYIMEMDEHYCSVIIRRWEEYTGLKAEKVKW